MLNLIFQASTPKRTRTDVSSTVKLSFENLLDNACLVDRAQGIVVLERRLKACDRVKVSNRCGSICECQRRFKGLYMYRYTVTYQ